MENHTDNTHNHNNVTHHKMNAIKAIKSGWKHIMKSPFTYIGFALLFFVISMFINFIPVISQFLSFLLSMVVLKFLLDKYEGKKVEINFSFMDYLHYVAAQFILGVGFLLLLIAIALPTFYPIYKVAVTDKQAFWGDVKTLMKEGERKDTFGVIDNTKYDNYGLAIDNKNFVYDSKEINLTQYIDITGDETIVFSLLTIFLIGFCAIIYLVFRVSVTQWFLIDKKFGPIEAIKHSWHATRNNMTQLSILAILVYLLPIALLTVIGLVTFITVIAFGLMLNPAFFTTYLIIISMLAFLIPLAYMISLDTYKQMIGESK